MINIPSSRFLRPYSRHIRVFEALKINRIINGMRYAARNNEVCHLWWHPHNFGKNTDENFDNLEKILREYRSLKNSHGLESVTMTELAQQVLES